METINKNSVIRMLVLCNKRELNAKTPQKFTLPPPTMTIPSEKQRIYLAAASRRRDKNMALYVYSNMFYYPYFDHYFFSLFIY